MRNKSKTLAFAVAGAIMASGAAMAQDRPPPMDFNAPATPPVGPTLPGVTCFDSGGVNCSFTTNGTETSRIRIANCATVENVRVGADFSADFSGDITFSLIGPSGTDVELIPAPVLPGGGCPTPDMYTVLDDTSLDLVSTFCSPIPPGIQGVLRPQEALAQFNGELGTGVWTLSVTDAFPAEDDITMNDWSVELVCDVNADLQLTKSGPAEVTAGTNMTYTFEILNDDGPAGAAEVQNALVVDVLPAGVSYVGSTPNICAAAGQIVTCDVGVIAAGGDTSFTMEVAVAADVATGTVLTNDAVVSSEVNDPATLNNRDSVDTAVVRAAAVIIDKSELLSDIVVAGSEVHNVKYKIDVFNAGPSDITDLSLEDAITDIPISGAGWSISNSTNDCGSSFSSSGVTGTWTGMDIADGQTCSVQIWFTVASNAVEQTVIDTARILGSGGGETLADLPFDIEDTTVVRVATYTMEKTDVDDPVTAGSGIDNLVHVVTLENTGPSDISGMVLSDVPVLPAGIINPSLTPDANCGAVSGTGPFLWTLDLAAGQVCNLTVRGTVTLAAEPGNNVISNRIDFVSSAGGEELTGPQRAQQATSIVWPTATFNINKLYAGGQGPSVEVQLDCTDSTGLLVTTPATQNTDGAIVLSRFDHDTGTTCSVVETVPDGYYESQRQGDCDVTDVRNGSRYDCTLVNEETVARFNVTKAFSDQLIADVEVTLTCDTGLPLTQTLTITSDPADPGVTFVVTDFVDGTMSCLVTEAVGPDGYTVDVSDCVWDNVNSIDSPFACVIGNEANDATFTVYKEWANIGPGGEDVETETPVTIWCNSEITNADAYFSGGYWKLTDGLDDGESLEATVKTTTGPAYCWATEVVTDSAVESEDDCEAREIPAGGSDSCTFTNSVFFEGIPTLSQYGMAILALLMLGVGFVGFRRFV